MNNFSGIKNIVFDLGVVLFDLDYQLTIRAFEELGVHNYEELYSEAGQLNLFDKFERSEIQTPQFLDGMRDLMPKKADDQSIIDAWNAMLLGFPKSSIELLEKLKPRYKLFLLSNTNDLHFARVHEMIHEEHRLGGLDQFFIALYYSHREGLRKPEPAFYNRLIENEGLNPAETVFIDDMKKNVEGALEVGMKGLLLDKEHSVSDFFDENFEFKEI